MSKKNDCAVDICRYEFHELKDLAVIERKVEELFGRMQFIHTYGSPVKIDAGYLYRRTDEKNGFMFYEPRILSCNATPADSDCPHPYVVRMVRSRVTDRHQIQELRRDLLLSLSLPF